MNFRANNTAVSCREYFTSDHTEILVNAPRFFEYHVSFPPFGADVMLPNRVGILVYNGRLTDSSIFCVPQGLCTSEAISVTN